MNSDKIELKININKDDDELNEFLYCWYKFGSKPNKLLIYGNYITSQFNEIINNHILEKNVFTEIIKTEDEFIVNEKMFVKIDEDIYLSYYIIDKNNHDSIINDLYFLYKNYDENLKKIEDIIKELNTCSVIFKNSEFSNLNIITLKENNIELEPITSSFFKSDIQNFDLYYSSETTKKIKKIIKDIKNSNGGLIVFYGERGTGKTCAIEYLATKTDRNLIFIPNNMIEQTILNPNFISFLKKHYKPILIIDDCEYMFSNNFNKLNNLTNNLLQMVDSIISNYIECDIILIFNVTNILDIDETILNCNNLIDIVYFKKLNEKECENLCKHININNIYKEDTRVIDIIKQNKKIKNKFWL